MSTPRHPDDRRRRPPADELDRLLDLTDDAAALRAGEASLEEADAHVARVLRLLRAELLEPPADRERQLAAVTAAAAEYAHTAPEVGGHATSRRGRRAAGVFGLTAAKLALGAAVAVAATGGLAATGNLPDAAQEVVADVAARVGIELPRPAGHGGEVVDAVRDAQSDRPAPGEGPRGIGAQVSEVARSRSPEWSRAGGAPADDPNLRGRSGEAPGRSGDAPGRSGDAPGRSGDVPGRAGEAPGRDTPSADDAPQHTSDTPSTDEAPQGSSASADGATADDTPAGDTPPADDTPGRADSAPSAPSR